MGLVVAHVAQLSLMVYKDNTFAGEEIQRPTGKGLDTVWGIEGWD